MSRQKPLQAQIIDFQKSVSLATVRKREQKMELLDEAHMWKVDWRSEHHLFHYPTMTCGTWIPK